MAEFKPNIIFPADISQGSQGGPSWNTEVVETASGFGFSNQRWAETRHVYDVSYGIRTEAQLYVIRQLFHSVRGQTYGFKFRDLSDNNSTEIPDAVNGGDEETVANTDQTIASGDGTTLAFQLIKNYSSFGETYARDIQVAYDVVAAVDGVNETAFTVGAQTGIVTFNNLNFNITNISQAATAIVTIGTPTGMTVGQSVYISGVSGMTQINNARYTVVSVGANNIGINVDTTGFTAYTSGGTVKTLPQTGEVITAGYRFYVPVRFNTDRLNIVYENFNSLTTNLELIEIRL